nr:PREDICTED: uncharacterized protein LOC103315148 [Tribolium castaneum]|eukprot:XP_008201306.2 PREDICTED: uncharacterized protein LOC103315148 [Tribolium castaneum]
MDIVEPLNVISNGNKYILTCMDYLTKYPECIPVKDMKAETVGFRQKLSPSPIGSRFVQIKISSHSRSATTALKTACSTWLKEEVRPHYTSLNSINWQLRYCFFKLNSTLHPLEFDILDQTLRDNISRIGQVDFIRLGSKLASLESRQIPQRDKIYCKKFSDHKFHDRVVNLSSHNFTRNELQFLEKGLKYIPFSNTSYRDIQELAVDCQVILNRLPKESVDKLTPQLISALNKIDDGVASTQSPPSEDSRILRKISKMISAQNNLIISKADKGNAVVVLDRANYKHKVHEFLDTGSFSKLPRNCMKSFMKLAKSTVNDCLETLKYFNCSTFNLIPMNPRIPRLYGLPKIHKPECPIRRVVSFINSPVYRLAHWLNTTLRNIVPFDNSYSIINSGDLTDKLRNLEPPPDSFLVSFDVTNLFPSIPSKECLSIVKDLLFDSGIPVSHALNLFSLTELVLDQNFFLFDSDFYAQDSGLAMGSSLSPLLAEIFMTKLEKQIFARQESDKIIFWYRYVDDVLALFKGSRADLDYIDKYSDTDIVTTPSTFANHILENKHSLNPALFKILHRCNKSSKLNFLEVLEILNCTGLNFRL